MKNLIFVGLILFVIGGVIFYIDNAVFDLRVFYSALCGIGIGLLIGGIFGYIIKGNALKAAKVKKELEQLKKEKIELENSLKNNSSEQQL